MQSINKISLHRICFPAFPSPISHYYHLCWVTQHVELHPLAFSQGCSWKVRVWKVFGMMQSVFLALIQKFGIRPYCIAIILFHLFFLLIGWARFKHHKVTPIKVWTTCVYRYNMTLNVYCEVCKWFDLKYFLNLVEQTF